MPEVASHGSPQNRPLRAGVIGLGVGEQHVVSLLEHPDVEVAVICDLDREKREMARQRYPEVECLAQANDVLDRENLDLVSIASYDDVHFEQIERGIQNGKHLFVEKPVVLHESEARTIRKMLDQRPELRLSSNLVLRQSPRFREVRSRIREGQFGEVFYLEGDYNYGRLHKIVDGWRGRLDYYSVVLGGAVHIIDLLMWLTGERIVEVQASGNQIASAGTGFRFNDFVVSVCRFESGALAKVSANFGCVHPHHHDLVIHGTKATFVNHREGALMYTSRNPESRPESIDSPYPGVHKGDVLSRFVDSLLGRAKSDITEEDVFKTLSVCFAIEKAVADSRLVRVEYI